MQNHTPNNRTCRKNDRQSQEEKVAPNGNEINTKLTLGLSLVNRAEILSHAAQGIENHWGLS
jgi:hypothetical protein